MNFTTLAAGGMAVLLAAALSATTINTAANASGSSSSPPSSSGPNPGALPDRSFGPTDRAAAIRSFQRQSETTASQLRLSTGTKLVVRDVVQDADGTQHVRYDRTYRGLPVVGGDLVVHDASASTPSDVTWDGAGAGNFRTVKTRPKVPASAALRSAGADASNAKLVVWAVGKRAKLAWNTTVPVAHGLHEVVVTNARSGKEILRYDLEQTADAVGTGQTLYSGDVPIRTNSIAGGFEMRDLTRGGHRVTNMNNSLVEGGIFTDADNLWGDNTKTNAQTVAADAHYGAAVTWDFFKSLGRNGIRNDGVGARSRVHYSVNYDNAFWDDACFCMTYGDGSGAAAGGFEPLVPLDVAGHEMTHGVTSFSAGLHYFGESGGLNEATSDIFGSMVEFRAANAVDRPDYYIGEEIAPGFPGGALRRMDRPSLDGNSYNCYTAGMGRDDVHFTSGVGNHFYYLLAEGSGAKVIGGRNHNSPVCAGGAITGIGQVAARRIWYRALNIYMVEGSDYKNARDATIRAARDLYGAASVNCARVVQAWTAVRVTAGAWACPGEIDPATGVNAVRNPGFETATNGASWTQVPGGLVGPFGFERSGAKHAYLRGWGVPGTDTLSQNITVPAAGTPKLVYYLLIDSAEGTTTAFDFLRVQITHGATTTTVQTASNRTWDDSYHRMVVNLSAYAGQAVTLKFVAIEDATLQTGFLIDDIRVASH